MVNTTYCDVCNHEYKYYKKHLQTNKHTFNLFRQISPLDQETKHCAKGKPSNVQPGCFYVAVTRVKRLTNLYLKAFDTSLIALSKPVERELLRLSKPTNMHKLCKKFLPDQVFAYDGLRRT